MNPAMNPTIKIVAVDKGGSPVSIVQPSAPINTGDVYDYNTDPFADEVDEADEDGLVEGEIK